MPSLKPIALQHLLPFLVLARLAGPCVALPFHDLICRQSGAVFFSGPFSFLSQQTTTRKRGCESAAAQRSLVRFSLRAQLLPSRRQRSRSRSTPRPHHHRLLNSTMAMSSRLWTRSQTIACVCVRQKDCATLPSSKSRATSTRREGTISTGGCLRAGTTPSMTLLSCGWYAWPHFVVNTLCS